MRTRILTMIAALSIAALTAGGADPAWANDPNGQYGWAGAAASGGQLSVQAGQTFWTPPAGSKWATPTKTSSGSSGRPNPNQPYGCTYQTDPTALQTLGPGGTGPGEWVIPTCAGPGVINPMPLVWVTNAKPAAAVVTVSPVVAGVQAEKELPLVSPVIEMAPPSGSAQLVGVPTWLWIDPAAWNTLTATATAGNVTATATAAPAKVVWDLGDGDTVTCDGPGTPYSPSAPDESTGCSYAWPEAGSFTVTATVYWSVSWAAVGAVGGGNLGVQAGPPSQVNVAVTESQAINTAAPIGGGG